MLTKLAPADPDSEVRQPHCAVRSSGAGLPARNDPAHNAGRPGRWAATAGPSPYGGPGSPSELARPDWLVTPHESGTPGSHHLEDAMQAVGDPESSSPLVRAIREITESSLRNTDLLNHDVLMVRLAILIALDAPGYSYLLNLAGGTGGAGLALSAEEVEAVLVAAAPLVGTARVVSAAERISEAVGYPISVVDLLARG